MIDVEWKPEDRILRQFSIVALIGFGLIGVLVGWKTGAWWVSSIFWGVGALAFLTGLVWERGVLPLYIVMMAIALPIGLIISNLVLIFLFYGLFTPVALFFKLTGRDPLHRKLEPEKDSYWIAREEDSPAKSYYRQF